MTAQTELYFDPDLAEILKRAGVAAAENHRKDLLVLGRYYIRQAALSRADKTATADDAARGFLKAGLPCDVLGNAAGALFRGGEWEFTGRMEKSKRITNHAHRNMVWRYRDSQGMDT
jgi:hypothetical protein